MGWFTSLGSEIAIESAGQVIYWAIFNNSTLRSGSNPESMEVDKRGIKFNQ
jgi:hypothetical protein